MLESPYKLLLFGFAMKKFPGMSMQNFKNLT